MNASELLEYIGSLDGARAAGGSGNGIAASQVLRGVEYGHSSDATERKLRASWKRRAGGGGTALLLFADDPEGGERVLVLGPQPDGPLRTVRVEGLRNLIGETTGMADLAAVRHLAAEIERLDSSGVAGLVARGIGTEHLYRTRLPGTDRWAELSELAPAEGSRQWRDVLVALGYEVEQLPKRGYLAKFDGVPVLVVHPKRSASEFARLDDSAKLPEGALLADCRTQGAPFGMLAAGSRMRLLQASGESAGQATNHLEIDAALIEPEMRPLLAILSPTYLARGGLADLLVEARDYGSALRRRLDRALRQDVLPVLGLELGRWAEGEGLDPADDELRSELESAALTFVFRALFLLYAESAGYLPMANNTYAQRSLTRTAERAAAELETADPQSTSLWDDVTGLVKAMRNGQSAWGVPAYNGALFAATEFDGAEILERASIPDKALGRALVALARDPDDLDRGVDFSGLEIGHVGHIYEGLLSLRLSVADRDLRYDESEDRYRPVDSDDEPSVREGELLWLTNEGGRKGGGVYYTPVELVRHLVRQSVRPAFKQHLERVREVAETDRDAAAGLLFDFYVLDPACGSAHFLVEVTNELADQIAELAGEIALPALREDLAELRRSATATLGVEVDDAALLRRLALKRCVHGVDLSPMGAEIAKVSLWLATFVPGLSLSYLASNIQVGNSLIGVSRVEELGPPEEDRGTIRMFDDELLRATTEAAARAAELRAIADRTPQEVAASRDRARALADDAGNARRVFDLWVAEPLGLEGAREEVNSRGPEIVAGQDSPLADRAEEVAGSMNALHWPLAFPHVFARERQGFDVVVGNPPWEEVTVEELAYYALYKPGLRGLPARERRSQVAELRQQRPELDQRLEAERERLSKLRSYLGPASGYQGSAGDPDVYKYFCQRYRHLLRAEGRLGVVLPRSALLAKGSAGFRRWLFGEAAPDRVDVLLNNRLWMFDTHPQYTIALLAAENRELAPEESFELAGVADSADAFRAQASARGIELRRAALGPELEVPLVGDQAAADLLAKLRDGEPFPLGAGRGRCFPVREFDETNDAELWEDAESGWPLWKGGSFDQFDPNGADARHCPPSSEALKKARKPRPGSGSLIKDVVSAADRRAAVERTVGAARVAFRDVTRSTDSRTVRACLIPPEHFLTNKAPYLTFVDPDQRATAACLALMNSLAFDWQARRFVETNLNFFILEGLRLPQLDDTTFESIATAAARLSCPDDRFADFARELGVEHGPLDDDQRLRLRVEIDALVAHAWKLSSEELDLVIGEFTLAAVTPDYREALRDRYAELA